ncbi:Gfo/Idh/MocA family oxidoreductase [Candidatus Poribacteria bacterium]|nr:Gfo/Idh/MocA family oxidoreductase [Candidatus Poribacteria bacterium]MYG08869.1 Gfo/Idh/MocA family oxidoreductase [Candidatus Poribacteria bacterium]MYK23083.1 Gfo/Idh/MocA family oxidoreductase [Candidatus Poribacteria bacterium]
MSKRIKIGIIGCGMISGSHVNGYLAHPQHAEIVAVCDTVEANVQRRHAEVLSGAASRAESAKADAEKAETTEAREQLKANAALWAEYADNGVKIFSDYNEMIKACDLDAVSLATPPFVHEGPTVAAAQAGKHVFCEKPMARTATEARNMRDACDDAGVKLAYQSGGTCLDPTSYAIRDYVTSGKLGDVYYGRLTSYRVRGRPNVDMFGFGRWFLNSAYSGGGTVYDTGVYDINRSIYLLGSPQPATISGIAYRGMFPEYTGEEVNDVEEHISIFVRFTNGMSFTYEHGWASNMAGQPQGIFIFGSKGSFSGNKLFLEKGKWDTDDQGNRRRYQSDLVETPLALPKSVFPDKFRDFLDACNGDVQPVSNGDVGLKVTEIMSGSLLSAKLGREISVEELYEIEALRTEPTPGWPIP